MIKRLDYQSDLYNMRTEEFLVSDDATQELIADLRDTLESLEDKLFLVANEIGRKERAFGIKFADGIKLFLNPVYQAKGKPVLSRELDEATGETYLMPRFNAVTLCYQDECGKTTACQFKSSAALLVCRAMDCLDGLHDTDYGLVIIPEFDTAPVDQQSEVIKTWLNSLSQFKDELDTDLTSNEETKAEWTSYNYMKAKAEGKIEVMQDEPKMNRKQRRLWSKLKKKLKIEV